MRKIVLALALVAFLKVNAQQPKRYNPSEIYEAVKKLNFLGSALYIAAHPDDENTRLISYLSNNVKARTAYLSLTRGDGGQNLIGTEIRELLGVMRTQELLGARSVDGGEQLFTRANDFGYSKHPDETLSIWNKEEVLGDVVRAIRKFKPDVIVNRFNHRTPGTTHGHHTSSAMLSVEAFDLVGDKTKFKEQLNTLETWQPRRLFFNTSWWFYGSQEKFAKADKSNMLNVDVGAYYPSFGLSNNEIASIASSQHLCQGFGRLTTRGSQNEYIELLKGDLPKDKDNIFDGIDTSWNRVKGGKKVGAILEKIEANFNFRNPTIHLDELAKAFQLINTLEDDHWKEIKLKEITTIISACAGLYLEASTSESAVTPGSLVDLNIEAINRSSVDITIENIDFPPLKSTIDNPTKLIYNERQNIKKKIAIPLETKYTSPYWLMKEGTNGMYQVDNKELIGKPETPRFLHVNFDLSINGTKVTITRPVVYRYSKPDKGELYKPFEILPEVTASFKYPVIIFDGKSTQDVQLTIRAGKDGLQGKASLTYPKGWTISPREIPFEIKQKGDVANVMFKVTPPKTESVGTISPKIEVKGIMYNRQLVEIDYDHIPFQSVLLPAKTKVVNVAIQKNGTNIAYIAGAGDVIPESLRQIGYNVTVIPTEKISENTLVDFDAVVLGIRAYNVVEDLKFKQRFLLDFVKNGGNMIVQYNTAGRRGVDVMAPYELKMSRDRVTDETADVRILNADHAVMNFPNSITKNDFDGWVQERGLYFPRAWDDSYTPILSMNDKGETAKDGSLLIAKYGEGHYIYTGLSFFRELPAGVPGAYKLFANMLSLGKGPQSSKIKG
ncbi:PIG-L family deacetylase [Spongiivirga citrea]|uniref:LmbE family protein n=1 Tax=Spongiivirga citrea TaxID=1481457 RepID=A0A6M0CHM1_9FLAO|nr:PIG-L family deacetylase [Spongiivirga citrea]NER17448.1 LmbE family protein [Spongiivirga citrea]